MAAILGRQPVPVLKKATSIGVLKYGLAKADGRTYYSWTIEGRTFATWKQVYENAVHVFDWENISKPRKRAYLAALARKGRAA